MALTIIFTIMAVILFLGMIADKDYNNRKNFAQAFMVVVAAIIILNIFQ